MAKKFIKSEIGIVIIILVVGIILYANTLPNQMFWDDFDGILNNKYIKDWQYIDKYFTENLIAGSGLLSNYWRPMLLSVFSLEWHLWQDWTPGYHMVNGIIHIADAILLFLLILSIFRKKLPAFLISLIFLSHPLQTEAVSYISGLGDPLSVFFILIGLVLYAQLRKSNSEFYKNPYYYLTIAAYIASLMTKETAIIMPALIVLVDIFFLQQNARYDFKNIIKKSLSALMPFIVIAGVYLLLRSTALNFINTWNLYNEENLFTENIFYRSFTFLKILTIYIGLMLAPFGLHMEREVSIETSLLQTDVILGVLIFIIFSVLAFTQLKKRPLVSFGIFWFFIGLFPTSNIAVPINGLIYEHWLYLPLIGFFLALIYLINEIGKKTGFKKLTALVFIPLLIFLSILTIKRNTVWKNPIVFYNNVLKYNPSSYRIINNLGKSYAERGNEALAMSSYKRAIKIDPSKPTAYHNLANIYRVQGKTQKAIENFNKAIQKDPNFLYSYSYLVNLYLQTGQTNKAREIIKKFQIVNKQ